MAVSILITDGEQRSALALVRSLGRAGFRVVVASRRPHSLAGASRYAYAGVQLPDARENPAEFADGVLAAAERFHCDVIIPTTEAALLSVLPRREQFVGRILPFPDADTFRRVADKRDVLRTASRLGIKVPAQIELETPNDLETADLSGLSFPAVIKPARSVARAGNNGKLAQRSVSYASTLSELRERVRACDAGAFPLLIQERIVGPGVGVFLLMWDGRIAATFSHRRLREKPPSGGVSVYSESIAADPCLVDQSRRLLDEFGWQGVAMVEFKMNAAGEPHLMEVNGRFWGSLQLAIEAGVDFPVLLVDAATRGIRNPNGTPSYRTGIRNRWWWGDVDQMLTVLRGSPAQLPLPADAPSRMSSIAEFLKVWRPGDRNEVLHWTDPAPFVRESIDWLLHR